ncbi:Cd2+/Zn2+-exporting ATPase [Aequorivita viscosa]|uniref:Cd2+/Zn2+-exporting ATPase n=1 Tax=Aequorivita viscosa TaxID=797419 RepID=A0A1M6GYT6_9FLAO|nr:Cd2+/Zn2+-exporting ATPase [Aequorivita viscosa]SHJ15076.1 Cd2+/Zn2+-exporting ATPase [Aequorivita viscosa]
MKAATSRPLSPKVNKEKTGWKTHWDLLLALLILVILLTLEYGFNLDIPTIPLLAINLIAYLLAGRKVLDLAWRKSKRGDFFNEFVLMSVATIGAFIIGEYEVRCCRNGILPNRRMVSGLGS